MTSGPLISSILIEDSRDYSFHTLSSSSITNIPSKSSSLAHSYAEDLTIVRRCIIRSKKTQMKGEMQSENYSFFLSARLLSRHIKLGTY